MTQNCRSCRGFVITNALVENIGVTINPRFVPKQVSLSPIVACKETQLALNYTLIALKVCEREATEDDALVI